jgi:hypothetical protein
MQVTADDAREEGHDTLGTVQLPYTGTFLHPEENAFLATGTLSGEESTRCITEA